MSEGPGKIALMGSGETSATGRRVFDWLFRRLPVPVRVAILETPAGFELNSSQVAGRIAEFIRIHLSSYQPQVDVVPARKRATAFSPDDPALAARLPGADVLFLGPGSPTFAVRQLQDSLVWRTALACHRAGSTLVLASAAVVAMGSRALPVYEIYKVGQDPHWQLGLDLLRPFGLDLVLIPHWNNQDGGAELDTSRCYIGRARLEPLLELLPSETTVVGIDEQTALVLDVADASGLVLGRESVWVMRAGETRRYRRGESLSLSDLGPFRRPAGLPDIPAEVLARLEAAPPAEPPAGVLALVARREAARTSRDWAGADLLRRQIAEQGWQVLDTPGGAHLVPLRRERR